MHEVTLPLLSDGYKKKWSYSALVFSLFYFLPLLYMQPQSTLQLIIIVTAYLAFVGTYLWAIHAPRDTLCYPLGVMMAIAYSVSLIHVGASSIFGFIAFICGYYFPPKKALLFAGLFAISLLLFQTFGMHQQSSFYLASAGNVIVLMGFGMMERKETISRLREAQQNASIGRLSAIAERERIGRDLHDIAGHALSSMSLKAQLADKLLEKGRIDQAREEMQALTRLSQSLLSEIRHAVSDMKKFTLEEEINRGSAALRDMGFEVNSQIDAGTLSGLTALQETHLALITKEAMTNILRHSNGKTVTIAARWEKSELDLTITDNGKTDCMNAGNGITGMRERAALIGAGLNLTFGEHTTLHITLPLQKQERE